MRINCTAHIEIVLPLPALQSVAYQDDALEGILNYHGESVPIYSLSTLVNVTAENITLDTPLILCKINDSLLGLLVSSVDEIISLFKSDIQNSPLIKSTPHIEGIVENSDGSSWILDLEYLINNRHITKTVSA